MSKPDVTPEQTSPTSPAETASPASKLPYTSPALRLYGSISRLTLSGGPTTTEGASGMGMVGSDPALKEHAVKVGVHPLGIGLYLFAYKPEYRQAWGNGRQFGVMADEVERVMPEAVSLHADGYKLVNYAQLGIARAAA